jgi:hypothetical protein
MDRSSWIATWSPLRHFDAFANPKRAQLIDRRCTECIRGNEEWCEPCRFCASGELGRRGGLPYPVDANEEHHVRLLLLARNAATEKVERCGAHTGAATPPIHDSSGLDKCRCGGEANVAGQERLFNLAPIRF